MCESIYNEQYQNLLTIAVKLNIIDANSCDGNIMCLIGKIKNYYISKSLDLLLDEVELIKEILEKLELESKYENFYNDLVSYEIFLNDQNNLHLPNL